MMFHRPQRIPRQTACAACALGALLASPVQAQQTANYLDRDNVEGPLVLLNSAPIRPMTYDGNGDLWVVNHPGNTVERFVGAQTTPVSVYPVPWGPVAVATYVNASSAIEVLCVTRNTWALTRLDAATGAVLDVVPLESEPGDILVDQVNRRAFVSCMGGDSVLQIDLSVYAGAPARRYHHTTHPGFLLKSPLFMSFDAQGDVLVAPLHSGNNSTPRGPENPNPGSEVIDLYNPANTPSGRDLPDQDLFVIDPDTGANGTVKPVARRMGTLLFAHGTHANGDFWQLNTDAVNQDPTKQSEPLVRGQFARNQVTIVPTPFSTPTQANPALHYFSLDPGGSFTTTTTVAQPFALAFHPTGKVFVCGLGSDNVAVLNANGTLFKEWDLPDGSIPRGLVVHSSGTVLLVYCFGTNEVRTYRWGNNPPTPLITYKLSHDPTPTVLKEGRAVFFDAGNSAQKNLSCATCHFDGGSDLLAWNLSNLPKDDKGPMITQTLVGLERLAPFHWRGERELIDFNGAFDGLLGNNGPIAVADFDKMQAWLFALKNPANPFQNRERVIDSSIQFITNLPGGATPPVGNAVIGQTEFRNTMTFQDRFTCNTCHAQPTGSNNAIVNDFPSSVVAEKSHLKVAPFHETWRRQQTVVDLSFTNTLGVEGPHRRSFLGVGASHSGAVEDVFRFIELVPGGAALGNIAAFVHQWDQGLAPAVHATFLLNGATLGLAGSELQGYLEKQAAVRNCDLVAFGTLNILGVPTRVRWNFDRTDTTGKPFKADHPAVAPRSTNDFIALSAGEPHVFVGLPVGMGQGFAVDLDRDGVWNGSDNNPLVPGPLNLSDTTAPGLVGAPSFPWISTRTARIGFDSDEPTTARVRYWISGSPGTVKEATSDVLGQNHALMLSGLRTSSAMASTSSEFTAETVTYDVEVTLTDRTGNSSQVTLPMAITSKPHILPDQSFNPLTSENDRIFLHEHRVAVLQMDPLTVAGSGVHVRVMAATSFKQGAPARAKDRAIVGRVLRIPAGQHLATLVSAADLTAGTGCLEAAAFGLSQIPAGNTTADGPYLITTSLTDASGGVTLEFDVANVAPGDTIQFNIEAVVEIPDAKVPAFATEVMNCAGNPSCTFLLPVNTNRAFSQWDFPMTKEANTCVGKTL